jgi:hypothetical protein
MINKKLIVNSPEDRLRQFNQMPIPSAKLCIDAKTFPCQYHSDKDTFGRRMHQSGKAINVKPVVFQLNYPGRAPILCSTPLAYLAISGVRYPNSYLARDLSL